MKDASIFIAIFVAGVLVFEAIHFLDDTIAPLFLNSRIERLGERNLPRIVVERDNVVYCRMNADDFRFPLPSGSRATNLVVSVGFDTVDGSIEARFDKPGGMRAGEYQSFLAGKVPEGGQVTVQTIAGGLLIKFHYFGDR